MKNPRTTILIGILVLVNVLVFGSLLVLLFNAVSGGSASNAPTSTPRILLTPTLVPPPATSTSTRVVTTPAVSSSTTVAATPSTGVTYPFTYTVQAGDSISLIAKRFNVPAAKIMAANNITNPDLIKVGQVLIIPDPNK
jgi:LysM repeat protein